jgi:hypothetical protein
MRRSSRTRGSTQDSDSKSWRIWPTFGALGVIWGVPYFFIRIAVQEVPPLVVAWGRITLAALILLPNLT